MQHSEMPKEDNPGCVNRAIAAGNEIQATFGISIHMYYCTEFRYKVGPRLLELAPAAREGQQARSRNLGPAL